MAQRFQAARSNAEARKPEIIELREQINALRRQARNTQRDHARTVRDLESLIRTYANQIHVLALRCAGLEQGNHRLHQHQARDTRVVPIQGRP